MGSGNGGRVARGRPKLAVGLTHPGPKALARIRPSREAEIMPTPQKVPAMRQSTFARSSVGKNSVTSAVVTGKLPAWCGAVWYGHGAIVGVVQYVVSCDVM